MKQDYSGIKYLLFDHDGVLVDTEYWYFRATRTAIGELGIDLTLERYRQHLVDGSPSWALAQEAGIAEQTIDAARQRRNDYYQSHLITEDIEIDGVTEVLDTLSQDYAMAIVTTARKEDFQLIHQDRRISQYMDFVLAKGDYPRAKPKPDPYLEAMRRFSARPDECLVIEDSERGLRSAIAAGVACVMVHHDFTAHQSMAGAAGKLATLSELPALLGKS